MIKRSRSIWIVWRCHRSTRDRPCWKLNPSSVFFAKSYYDHLYNGELEGEPFHARLIWKVNATLTIAFFTWEVVRDSHFNVWQTYKDREYFSEWSTCAREKLSLPLIFFYGACLHTVVEFGSWCPRLELGHSWIGKGEVMCSGRNLRE